VNAFVALFVDRLFFLVVLFKTARLRTGNGFSL